MGGEQVKRDNWAKWIMDLIEIQVNRDNNYSY